MLYKYSSWNDPYTKANIKSDMLYFNTPESFNDPFDIFARFSIGDRNYLENRFCHEGIKEDTRLLFSDGQVLDFARLMDRAKSPNSRYGITCFSSLCDSILMWAMYGDKNRGICLGFDIDPKNEDSVKKILSCDDNLEKLSGAYFEIIKVKYESERPELSYTKAYDIGDLLRTKFDQWSYENEVRVMIRAAKEYVFPTTLSYANSYLKEIVIGSMMPVSDFLAFYDQVVTDNITIDYKLATLDKSSYKYNVVSFPINEMRMLKNNIEYLYKNANKIISENELLRHTVDGLSKTKSRNLFRDAVYALPLYYFKEYFSSLTLNPYDNIIRVGTSQEDIIELCAFYNYIDDEIHAMLKK